MDIRQQLLSAFELEHREHLDSIRAGLSSHAANGQADWNDIFRRAHSLKGAARAVDLPPVEALAHRLETLFERIRTGVTPLERHAMSAAHLALDRIEAFVAQTGSGTPSMPPDAAEALDACLAGEPPTVSVSATTPRPGMQLQALPAEPVANETPSVEGALMLRVPAAAVRSVADAAHGLAHALPAASSLSDGIARVAEASNAMRRRAEAARAHHRAGRSKELRGVLDELDAGLATLAQIARELSRVDMAASTALEAASARVREEAERLSLAPAQSVFGGFARAVREMAREAGHEVDIALRGLDVPLDRAVLQELKDPVLHALRNALSHGAEPPDVRIRAGKPAALGIVFEVSVRGGRLLVGVHDDGRGPNLAAIEARARDHGLLSPGEQPDRNRLLAVVFKPGFSTATSIDALAGRGMGLSVVSDAARRLEGRARLAARDPNGTSLLIDVPLAASRRQMLLVEAGGSTYAIASAAVERLLRLPSDGLGTVAGRAVIRLEENDGVAVHPFAELNDILRAPAPERSGSIEAVVLRSGESRWVFGVERLSEARTFRIMPPPPVLIDRDLVIGVVVVGVDRPVLVLDPQTMIERATAANPTVVGNSTRPATSSGTMESARRSTILVVDDSITTRTLEKGILEAAGYRVVVCVDGQDALEYLRSDSGAIDLVVADVEMPRMDGFGLVRALRSELAFKDLPVVLMTSRGEADDVARGLELGADAYLTKQKFDQRELLRTIERLL